MKRPFLMMSPNRVWRTYPGGMILDRWEGKEVPTDTHFPEDWIASTTAAKNIGRENVRDEGLARTSEGADGRLLADVLAEAPEYYFGPRHARRHGADPRFLLKYLDSAIRLHIQVHPTVAFARAHLGANYGKTEGYYILGSRETAGDAVIYIGFRDDIDPTRLKQWVADQDIDALLSRMHALPVEAGDCFIVPGGLPHAIGAGVYMLEVMEPSDFAVRFEFERGGYVLPETARFMGRGVDFGVSMTDLAGHSRAEILDLCRVEPRRVGEASGIREDVFFDASVTDRFTLRRYAGIGAVEIPGGEYAVAVAADGRCSLNSKDDSIHLETHDRCVIAAGCGPFGLTAEEPSELLLFGPPR